MKKLTLQLDELRVESFRISNQDVARGTVRGHDLTEVGCYTDEAANCGSYGGTCEWPCWTYNSCGGSCNTCQGTCNCSGVTCEPTAPDPVGTCCYNLC